MNRLSWLLLLSIGSGWVEAVPVTLYLNSVTLNDGGFATGSFVYDADANTYSSVAVFTTPGTGVTSVSAIGAGANYFQQSPGGTASHNTLLNSPVISSGITRSLTLAFAAPLTNAGGTVALGGVQPEGFCSTSTCSALASGFRVITGGTVVASSAIGAQIWYLRNLRFDDGGLAMGTFTYDASTNTFSNVDIWVSAGTTFSAPRHYGAALPAASAGVIAVAASNSVQSGDRALIISISGAMTNADGTFLPGGGVTAEETCSAANCTTAGAPMRLLTGGYITTERPNDYTRVLSDIVDGTFSGFQFQTTVIATNLTDQPIAFNADFFQDNGAAFSVPGIGAANSLQVVPGRGTLFLSSAGGTNTGVEGWMRARGAENLALTVIFTQRNANSGGDVQNVVANEPIGAATFSMAFDNTAGAVGGFALTNPGSQAMKVLAVAYDNLGTIILNDSSITLNPLSHTAFNFQNQAGYNVLVNKKGMIRIFGIPVSSAATAPLLGLDGLMIKFLPNNSTATIQSVHQ